ncbi:RFXX [Ceraceosorus bombacis]|uniref:RFXX n=1 Tax=Ceraceosorus bombacis TaxID=401625 RepID=A0A0P1BD98_9BASI|nr:RFXX [Ceraceosorus bombacis]
MLSFVPDPASFLAPTIPSTNIIVASPKDYGREVQAQPQPPTNKWLQSGANLSLDDFAPGYYDEARTPRAVSIPAAYTASAAPVLGENFSAEPCALYDGSLLPRRLAPSDTVTRSNSLSGAFDMAYTTHVQPTSASNTVQSDATTNAPLSGISHWKPDATLMQLACEVIEAHSQPHRRAQFETASHKFARAWLESSYVASAAAPTAPIRRSAIARSYQLACAQYGIVAPLSVSVVGKILKSTFPGLQHRRLGSRACSVWHYLGLKALTPHEEHMLGVVYDAMDAERRASAPTNKYALSEAGIHAQDSDCDEESSLDGTFDRCASFSSDSSHSRQNSISVLEVEQMLDNLKIKGRGVRAISDWPRAANTVSIGLDDLARTTWAQLEGTYQQQLEAFESLDFAMFKQLAVQQYRGASRDTIWAIWGNETLCGLVSSAETLLYEHLLRLLDAHISDPPIESVCAGLQDLATTLAVEVYASLHGVDGGPHPSSHARTSSSTTPRFPDAFIEQKCETVRRWSKCLAGICSIWSGVIELRSRSHLASEAWKGFAAPLDFTAHDSAQLDHSSSARFADFDGSAMDPDDYSLSRPPTRGADNSLNVEATSEIWQFNAPNSSIESMASSDINETTSSLDLRSRHMQENGFGNIITKWSDDDAEGERDEDFDQLISPASSTSSNMDWDAATPNKAASSTEHLDGAANNSGLTHLADVGPMLAV